MIVRVAWATLWAVTVVASAAFHLLGNGWEFGAALLPALLPYLAGAFIGGLFGLAITAQLADRRSATTRFAAFFASTAIMTLGFTALFFFIPHRVYFAQWHADPFSVTWLFQIFFTGLGSAYLFISTGLRPLVPWALIALAIASISFSRGRFPAPR